MTPGLEPHRFIATRLIAGLVFIAIGVAGTGAEWIGGWDAGWTDDVAAWLVPAVLVIAGLGGVAAAVARAGSRADDEPS